MSSNVVVPIELAEDALQAAFPPAVDVEGRPHRELLLSGRGWQAFQHLMREALRREGVANGELPPPGPDNSIELGMEALEFEGHREQLVVAWVADSTPTPWVNRSPSPSDWGSQQEALDKIAADNLIQQQQARVAAPLVMSFDEWLLHRGHMEEWMANSVEDDWLVNFDRVEEADEEQQSEGMLQRAWRAARRVGRAVCQFFRGTL